MTTSPLYHKRTCSVALLAHIKNPILLAKETLIRGNHDLSPHTHPSPNNNGHSEDSSGPAGGAQGHCFLSGPAAEELGRQWGLAMVEERYFWTRRRWEQHRRGLERHRPPHDHHHSGEEEEGELDERDKEGYWSDDEPRWDGNEYLPQGTVGCVVLDSYGDLCVATSTGGLTNKLPGRIGDTPTPGAGFWAEDWVEPPPTPRQPSPLAASGLKEIFTTCFPMLDGYRPAAQETPAEKPPSGGDARRAVALSGTGNGDTFLRLAAARTAAAITRFSPHHPSLSSAVTQIAGPG
ncbi:MAG: hypothetical protein Q9181_005625, partial [Wetmoreana brouardii]